MKGKALPLTTVALLSLLYIAGLVHYAEVRPLDGDEGFYATAARLVWEGKAPYRDFFFPQAPLLPYLYSWIWAIQPRSLLAMRFLSAACGGLAVFLWGVWLLFIEKLPRRVALVTFVVILINPYWVFWNIAVKPFATANLLMSVAIVCLYAALHSDRTRWYFLGGLALGACASARLLYAPLIPAVAVWLFWVEWRTSKPPYPKALALLAGAAGGLSPIIFSFLWHPRAFIFGNLQYHGLQAGYHWVSGKAAVGYESAGQTLRIYFHTLVDSLLARHDYFKLEMLLSLLGGWSLLKSRRRQETLYSTRDYLFFKLAFLMLAGYTATALIPFPPFDQYFTSPLVPFLLPFVAEGLRLTLVSWKRWVALAVLAAPLLLPGEISKEALANSGYPWCQLSSYRKVAEVIQANSRPDDVVLSSWPGYVFESGRRYFPGTENQFVFRVTTRISPGARARYHLVSKDQILIAASAGATRTLVIGPWMNECYDDLSPSEVRQFHAAVNSNYSLIYHTEDVAVYRRRW